MRDKKADWEISASELDIAEQLGMGRYMLQP